MPGFEILQTITEYLWMAVAGFFAWVGGVLWKKNEDLSKISERVALLEETQVREDRVRELFREALKAYLDDQGEIKRDLKEIADNVVHLRISMAAVNAARGSSPNDTQE